MMKLRCMMHGKRVRVFSNERAYHVDFFDECPHANDAGALIYGKQPTHASAIVQAKIQGYSLRRWFS